MSKIVDYALTKKNTNGSWVKYTLIVNVPKLAHKREKEREVPTNNSTRMNITCEEIEATAVMGLCEIALAHIDNENPDKAKDTIRGIIEHFQKAFRNKNA